MSGTSESPAVRRPRDPKFNLTFRRLQRFSSYRKSTHASDRRDCLRLGATWDGRGTNFALFSANARRSTVPVRQQGRREIAHRAAERTEDVWHGYLAMSSPGQLYGYRVHGPYEPEHGHRFNANKLLLDPYAKRAGRPARVERRAFRLSHRKRARDLSFDRRDNARGIRRPSWSTRPSTGAAARAPRGPVGRYLDLRGACQGPDPDSARTCRPDCAAPMAACRASDDRASPAARRHRPRTAADPLPSR